MPIQAGTYRNTDGVFVFLSLSVAHSNCHTSSLSPNTFVDCCFVSSCLYSSLVVARHLSSFVTNRRSSSLVTRRCSLVVNSPSHSLSDARTHTISLLSLYSPSLVDCHCCSWHFRSSPSASLHLVTRLLPPSHPFPHSGTVRTVAYIVY
jgi:hypothetical protein